MDPALEGRSSRKAEVQRIYKDNNKVSMEQLEGINCETLRSLTCQRRGSMGLRERAREDESK